MKNVRSNVKFMGGSKWGGCTTPKMFQAKTFSRFKIMLVSLTVMYIGLCLKSKLYNLINTLKIDLRDFQ